MNITEARKEFLKGKVIKMTLKCADNTFGMLFNRTFVYDFNQPSYLKGKDLKDKKIQGILRVNFSHYVKCDLSDNKHLDKNFEVVENV